LIFIGFLRLSRGEDRNLQAKTLLGGVFSHLTLPSRLGAIVPAFIQEPEGNQQRTNQRNACNQEELIINLLSFPPISALPNNVVRR
jgi:hypothetical protein